MRFLGSRRSLVAVLVAASLVALAPDAGAGPLKQPPAEPVFKVTGTVTRADTGAPLAGICVWAYVNIFDEGDTGGYEPIGSDTTGADGRYQIESPDSAYQVDLWFDSECGAGGYWAYRMVSVYGYEHHTGVDVALQRGGRVFGRVFNAHTGEPIRAFLHQIGDYRSFTADASGRYAIGSLPVGTNELEFYLGDPKWESHVVTRTVSVAGGADTRLDVAVRVRPYISGAVFLKREGVPYPLAEMKLWPGGTSESDARFFVIEPDGTFGLYVNPGTYRAKFCTPFGRTYCEYWPNSPTAAGAQPIALNWNQTVTGITEILPPSPPRL